MKIGYQGDVGSNNEEAALFFIRDNFRTEETIELIPLISSENVINSILDNTIDYGVCAVRSFTERDAVKVLETTKALKTTSHLLEAVDVVQLPIHHSLFRLPGEEIDTLASHEQALIRTVKNRQKKYPNWKEVAEKDTAWCARALRFGELPANYGVICRKDIGEKYNLECLEPIFEDEPVRTEFMLFKRYQ